MALLMMLPFVVLLLAIAFVPFVYQAWWEAHFRKVASFLGGVIIFYYLLVLHDGFRLTLIFHEYLSFIILIGSFFVVASGIYLRVQGESTPLGNTLFLLGGALLASLIGTTGASMLLIRPWIHSNRYRITAFHLVFFIFMISNIGGGLTPIGDPPLFLGYLRGVPFFWVMKHLYSPWLVAMALLSIIFYFLDRRNFLRAIILVREEKTAEKVWTFRGIGNLGFLVCIVMAVFFPSPWRESVMILLALSSYFLTPKKIFESNKFNFHPIEEVAWLFFGIFATMAPVLDYLNQQKEMIASCMRLQPIHFYYLTGLVSAMLDNAPTYLTFLQLHLSFNGGSINSMSDVAFSAAHHASPITAISLGAVFFGGMTYIGNGPNFMIKSIAEEAGIKMPHFFKYIFYYSFPILLPILLLIGWLYCS